MIQSGIIDTLFYLQQSKTFATLNAIIRFSTLWISLRQQNLKQKPYIDCGFYNTVISIFESWCVIFFFLK